MKIDFVMHVENMCGKKITCICSGDSSFELGKYYPQVHRGMDVELIRKNKKYYLTNIK